MWAPALSSASHDLASRNRDVSLICRFAYTRIEAKLPLGPSTLHVSRLFVDIVARVLNCSQSNCCCNERSEQLTALTVLTQVEAIVQWRLLEGVRRVIVGAGVCQKTPDSILPSLYWRSPANQ
ncbi:unnamed protein product [Symbiodinium natans]|uniref:Uncharacterized protein n=1 Tax=Symbiodinium natans TaxID=878477 RepID=A0A812TC24_9DINO|nr:unnamed protein product [Symbiodinium natans]